MPATNKKISTRYENTLKAGDWPKAVKCVNRIAFYQEKDFDIAADHMSALLSYAPLQDVYAACEVYDRDEKPQAKTVNMLKRLTDIKTIYETPQVTNKVGMDDKFEAMGEFANVVARGYSNGLFISGQGGTGKTWEVFEVLNENNLVENEDYVVVKGYSTPKGLFNLLRDNSDKLIVFDDCDSIFKDTTGLNIIKAVLDTYPERRVTWSSASDKGDENAFSFTGRIIFISNLNPDQGNDNFKAVMTRVLSVAVGTTKTEVKDRMLKLVPKIASDLNQDAQQQITEFIEENFLSIRDLSLRFVVHLVSLYKYNKQTWKKLAFTMAS